MADRKPFYCLDGDPGRFKILDSIAEAEAAAKTESMAKAMRSKQPLKKAWGTPNAPKAGILKRPGSAGRTAAALHAFTSSPRPPAAAAEAESMNDFAQTWMIVVSPPGSPSPRGRRRGSAPTRHWARPPSAGSTLRLDDSTRENDGGGSSGGDNGARDRGGRNGQSCQENPPESYALLSPSTTSGGAAPFFEHYSQQEDLRREVNLLEQRTAELSRENEQLRRDADEKALAAAAAGAVQAALAQTEVLLVVEALSKDKAAAERRACRLQARARRFALELQRQQQATGAGAGTAGVSGDTGAAAATGTAIGAAAGPLPGSGTKVAGSAYLLATTSTAPPYNTSGAPKSGRGTDAGGDEDAGADIMSDGVGGGDESLPPPFEGGPTASPGDPGASADTTSRPRTPTSEEAPRRSNAPGGAPIASDSPRRTEPAAASGIAAGEAVPEGSGEGAEKRHRPAGPPAGLLRREAEAAVRKREREEAAAARRKKEREEGFCFKAKPVWLGGPSLRELEEEANRVRQARCQQRAAELFAASSLPARMAHHAASKAVAAAAAAAADAAANEQERLSGGYRPGTTAGSSGVGANAGRPRSAPPLGATAAVTDVNAAAAEPHELLEALRRRQRRWQELLAQRKAAARRSATVPVPQPMELRNAAYERQRRLREEERRAKETAVARAAREAEEKKRDSLMSRTFRFKETKASRRKIEETRERGRREKRELELQKRIEATRNARLKAVAHVVRLAVAESEERRRAEHGSSAAVPLAELIEQKKREHHDSYRQRREANAERLKEALMSRPSLLERQAQLAKDHAAQRAAFATAAAAADAAGRPRTAPGGLMGCGGGSWMERAATDSLFSDYEKVALGLSGMVHNGGGVARRSGGCGNCRDGGGDDSGNTSERGGGSSRLGNGRNGAISAAAVNGSDGNTSGIGAEEAGGHGVAVDGDGNGENGSNGGESAAKNLACKVESNRTRDSDDRKEAEGEPERVREEEKAGGASVAGSGSDRFPPDDYPSDHVGGAEGG